MTSSHRVPKRVGQGLLLSSQAIQEAEQSTQGQRCSGMDDNKALIASKIGQRMDLHDHSAHAEPCCWTMQYKVDP